MHGPHTNLAPRNFTAINPLMLIWLPFRYNRLPAGPGISFWLWLLLNSLIERVSETSKRACVPPQKLITWGFAAPSRATLANANQVRDWRIYADFAQTLIQEARTLYKGEPSNSTTTCMPWTPPPSICVCRFSLVHSFAHASPQSITRCSICAAVFPRWSSRADRIISLRAFSKLPGRIWWIKVTWLTSYGLYRAIESRWAPLRGVRCGCNAVAAGKYNLKLLFLHAQRRGWPSAGFTSNGAGLNDRILNLPERFTEQLAPGSLMGQWNPFRPRWTSTWIKQARLGITSTAAWHLNFLPKLTVCRRSLQWRPPLASTAACTFFIVRKWWPCSYLALS